MPKGLEKKTFSFLFLLFLVFCLPLPQAFLCLLLLGDDGVEYKQAKLPEVTPASGPVDTGSPFREGRAWFFETPVLSHRKS